jgi:prophage DNA circulation protein
MACDPVYLTASFNGLPFEVNETEDTFGRRGVQYEYPYQNDPFYIDLGKLARTYSVKGYLIGEDHVARALAMVASAEQEGPATLVHPVLGFLNVAVETLTVTHKYIEKRRYTELEFKLLEIPSGNFGGFFGSTFSLVSSLLSAVAFLTEETNSSLTAAWGVAQLEQSLTPADVNYVLNTLVPVQQSLTSTNTIEGNDWLDLYGDIQLTPALGFYPDVIVSLLGGIALVPSTDPEQYKLIAAGGAGTLVATGSRAEALTSYNAALRLQASGYVAETASNTEYTYLQQAYVDADWLDRVLTEEAYIASLRRDDKVFRAIQDFSSSAYTAVMQSNLQLPGIARRASPAQKPSLVVAQQLFGDARRAAELESLNPLHNPLAIGGSDGYWGMLR